MLTEVNLNGVYVPPFLVYACAVIPIMIVIRIVFALLAIDRQLWHPALVEIALSFALVATLVLFF